MGHRERINRLRKRMVDEQLDGFLISSPENRQYLSGFTGSAGYLLLTASENVLATDFRYTEQAGQQCPDYKVIRIGTQTWFEDMIVDSDAKRIGFEGTDIDVIRYQTLTDRLNKLTLKPKLIATTSLADELRVIKEPGELEVLQRAIDIADNAMEKVAGTIRPGMTEKEVAWQMELTMRELGADSISFDTIVAAGPHGAMAHHHPSDYIIQKGDPIVIDMGAKYNGYCSDMTRTFILGKADEQFRKVYDTVLAAQETAEATVRSGMTGGDADNLARDVIVKAGYGDTFGHSLGHGIGLAVHEFPRIGPNAPGILEDGMVFSVEPGIYISGWGGVRIEDLVVLEDGKARNLNHAHKRDFISL